MPIVADSYRTYVQTVVEQTKSTQGVDKFNDYLQHINKTIDALLDYRFKNLQNLKNLKNNLKAFFGQLTLQVIQAESQWKETAVSSANAYGLMQVTSAAFTEVTSYLNHLKSKGIYVGTVDFKNDIVDPITKKTNIVNGNKCSISAGIQYLIYVYNYLFSSQNLGADSQQYSTIHQPGVYELYQPTLVQYIAAGYNGGNRGVINTVRTKFIYTMFHNLPLETKRYVLQVSHMFSIWYYYATKVSNIFSIK